MLRRWINCALMIALLFYLINPYSSLAGVCEQEEAILQLSEDGSALDMLLQKTLLNIPYDNAVDFWKLAFTELVDKYGTGYEMNYIYRKGDGIDEPYYLYEEDVILEDVLCGKADSSIWVHYKWSDVEYCKCDVLISHSFESYTTFVLLLDQGDADVIKP